MFHETRKTICIGTGLVLIAAMAFGGRYKLTIDPETKEGYVLQQIKQERDPAKRITLMIQFTDEFPKDDNLPWVLEQLLPHFTETKEWAKVISSAEKLLSIRPDDLDAAAACMYAVQESGADPEQTRKYATLSWKLADALLAAPRPAEADKVQAWKESLEWATRTKQTAEYAIYAFAKDAAIRKQALEWLEELNPTSVYLISSSAQFASAYQQQGNTAKMLAAVKDALVKEPNNADFLATLAEHAMKANDHAAVVTYTGRLISALNGTRPPAISDADWTSRKTRYLPGAYWMNAVTSMSRGNLRQADVSFRAALQYFKGNRDYLSAGLYNLGYINYKLAETGEPGRVMEALKFSQQCLGMNGPHAAMAQQNIAAIKAEYNLQ